MMEEEIMPRKSLQVEWSRETFQTILGGTVHDYHENEK